MPHQRVKRVLYVEPPQPKIVKQVNQAAETAKKLRTRLSLNGIVEGNPPQAIIEDAETRKTFFVTEGQDLLEGAVVEKVTGNQAIIKLGDETITLTL